MKKLTYLLPLLLLLGACGNDNGTVADDATDTPTVAVEEGNNDDRLGQVAPPPPVCVYLTEAEVLSFFEAGVQVPMAGSRAPSSFHSCQYVLEDNEWSGFLVLEMPETTTKVQGIRDEVAGARGADAVKVGSFNGRIMNEGRILSVEADKPFRVKFSALPKQGFPEAFTVEQRRELIQQMAAAVLN